MLLLLILRLSSYQRLAMEELLVFLPLSLTHTHTHSLSLSLSLSHTHAGAAGHEHVQRGIPQTPSGTHTHHIISYHITQSIAFYEII